MDFVCMRKYQSPRSLPGSPHTDAPKWLKPYKQHAGTLGPGISFVTLVTDLLD